jgi:tripartite-type tricarboxylate transporter receptor subunit TctC
MAPIFRFAAVVFVTLALAQVALAQKYPARTIRLVASSTGGVEIVARIVADKLSQSFGHQVIVDPRTSAAGNIAAEMVAQAPADGYTVLMMTITHTVNASLYRKLSYDLVRDFAPVTRMVSTPLVVVTHPSLPVKSIGELVRLAKAKPGVINYASAGTGRPTHLAPEIFKKMAGIDMVHVPYKGGGEAQTSVVVGETTVYFGNIGTALPFVQRGKLRALAVTSPKRVSMLPDCPTIAESGYPAYQADSWFGLMVPVKTPREIVATLQAATAAALKDPDVVNRLHALAYIPVGDEPEQFGAYVRSEIARYKQVIDDLKLTVD